ncbi:MAG: M28 family peptidase [Gemmatimonadaceae bacterium]|nr:M28 family peptidase [Gemmatimonadaceae bacterium]
MPFQFLGLSSLALLSAVVAVVQATKPAWPDEGPRRWAPRPTVAAITANDLRTRLYQLADDSMAGRRIGEIGNAKGTDYIAAEFKRFGLRPGGDNGTYFQLLPWGAVRIDSLTSTLAVDGAALAPKREWIPLAGLTSSGIATRGALDGAATVFAGRWGDTAVVLDPALIRGKVAVFAAPLGATRTPPAVLSCDAVPDKFGADKAAAVEAAQRAADAGRARVSAAGALPRDPRAALAGATGVLLVSLDATSPATINGAFASRNALQPNAEPASLITGAAISRAVALRLFGKAIDSLAVGATGAAVRAAWAPAWTPSAYPARNVIAILPGSDPTRAAEYVLVGAHNDHVGTQATAVDHDSLRAVNFVTRRQGSNDPTCRPTADQQRRIDSLIAFARTRRAPERDSIFNGADDDGSGTAVLLEIAEQFAKERPARSIIFVSHQGEESGLLGSKWFVDHPTIPLTQIVAAHNMDMVGKGRADQVRFGGPSSVQTLGARRYAREFGDVIDSVNATRSEVMAIDRSWDVVANPMNRFCRSDQVNYVNKDIPVTYFSTGYSPDYHMLTDEPRYIDYDHSAKLGRFVHDVMFAIAQRPARFTVTGPDPTYPRCAR